MDTLRARLEHAIAIMRYHEAKSRNDGLSSHANTYEHCASLAAAALEEAPAAGCPCEPEGLDGLRCPDANGRLLCAPEQPGSSVQGEACSPGEAAPPPSTPAQHYFAERHVCPRDSRYYVLLDPSEAYPDDPSNGAPAMVYGPNGASGTFHCVLDNGSINWGDVDAVELPGPVYRWLESISEYVEAFVDAAHDHKRCAKLAAAPTAPGVWVDEATLRQALHAMKRCKQESPSGKSWDMPIAKLTAALAIDGGKGE